MGPDARERPGQGAPSSHQATDYTVDHTSAQRRSWAPESYAERVVRRDRGKNEVAGQLDAFSGRTVREPIPAGLHDPPTSWQSAKRVRGSVHHAGLAAAILDAIRALGDHGATPDEMKVQFSDEDPGSVGKRMTDLARRELIRDSGGTRLTRRHRPAQVWVAR